MSAEVSHASHAAIVNRLNRAGGHLRRVTVMIEEGRPCLDIAQQLQAVERAIVNAKRVLIHDHLDHCFSGEAGAVDLDEFRAIVRYL
ncbi:MAG: metal-sensing transcriptional repressor [Myxococcota bacterium]